MNERERAALQERMSAYYANTAQYHQDIDDVVSDDRPSDEEKALFRAIQARLQVSSLPYVVELGCGRGESGAGFVSMLGGAEYLGMDASPSAIASAAKRYPQLRFEAGDITSLKLPKQADVIFANYVLEHTVYPEKIFESVSRSLKPGGLFGLILPLGDFPWEIPPSQRDKRLNLPYRAAFTSKRVLRQLRTRYASDYFETHLISDPIALRDANWAIDDDLVYWSSGVELEKLGRQNGLEVAWATARALPPPRPGNKLDALRRLLTKGWQKAITPATPLGTTVRFVFRRR
jgi:SAM-dependent methyltransferase